jgi:two-component system phosphate regulon sensor histidine kinase PhoR
VIAGAGALLVLVFAASAFAVLRAFRREAAALRARSDFVTGVTHELKTPVAAIRLVADVLHDDDVPPARQREYFALLAGETARLSALVDNVLDVGQIERGERAYDLRPCDLGDVVRDGIGAFAPLARAAGLELALRVDPAPAPAVADAAALQQALFAICENARKYAASGGRLDVAASRAGDTFAIELRDFGPGVAPSEREAIFARFQRGSAQRSGTVPGVGLGLYLARRIVERHGGTLVCRATANGPGARFVLTLPLAGGAATTTTTTTIPTTRRAPPPAHRP